MSFILNNACFAYFGLFLAEAMEKKGCLGTFYTNLPYTRVPDVPRVKVKSNPYLVGPYYLAGKFKLYKLQKFLNYPSIILFDNWVARNMTTCDIFHCFSAFGLKAHRTVRERYGAMTVVERGSTHIEVQNELMKEEHDIWGISYKNIDQRIMDRELTEYEECDYITVQSTFAERTFIRKGIHPEKLIRLPLGVKPSLFRPVPKRDTTFRVIYAGHVSLRKGVLYLLQAIDKLHLPNFEFVINGSVDNELKELIKPYWHKVKYLGLRPFNELYEVYSQASVCVLPTIEDGFAKIITEMMACGIPVITTNHCSAEDIITDGVEGFIIPVRNPDAIREKIVYLYENPAIRDAMAQAAFQRAKTTHSWDTYGDRALASYERAFNQFKQKNQGEI